MFNSGDWFFGEIRNENHVHRGSFEPIGFYCAIRGRMGWNFKTSKKTPNSCIAVAAGDGCHLPLFPSPKG